MALQELGAGLFDFFGGLIGDAVAAGDYAEAERLRREAAKQGIDIPLPDEMAQLGPSAFEGVRGDMDPRLRQARMDVLSELMETGMAGGMDPQARAALAEARQEAAQYEQGQRGAVMANAASRGMANSNMAQASLLQATQSGANRLSAAGTQAAADARQRALQALSTSGQLAAGLERDEYGQHADLADRRDAIEQFNRANAQNFAQQRFANQGEMADRRRRGMMEESDIFERRGNRTVDKFRAGGRAVGGAAGFAGDAYFKTGGLK